MRDRYEARVPGDKRLHFTVEHCGKRRPRPWVLYRETGYGGAENFATAKEAMAWGSTLNPRVVWERLMEASN